MGLEEIAAIRNPRPLKALLFLLETLSGSVPGSEANHLDRDSYSWQSSPYMFAAFRAAVISLLDVLRPPGEIVTPPPGPLLNDEELGELQVTFPDSPEEYGRLCARDLLSTARMHSQTEQPDFNDVAATRLIERMLGKSPRFARVHYGLADAWEGLNKAVQRRERK